ncbi:MAG: hypothetical protein K8R23_10435 [Chthoniobacter sp.]|nr:hypothetical protein [Chthoniobacter sp.]
MNEPQKIPPHDAIDIRQLARAIRFAHAAFLLVLSYLSLWSSMSIRRFIGLFEDMLGGQQLPALTQLVSGAQDIFVLISVLVPVVAVWMLFHRSIVRSFYIIGALSLFSIAQLILLNYALAVPLVQILNALSNPADMPALPPPR